MPLIASKTPSRVQFLATTFASVPLFISIPVISSLRRILFLLSQSRPAILLSLLLQQLLRLLVDLR